MARMWERWSPWRRLSTVSAIGGAPPDSEPVEAMSAPGLVSADPLWQFADTVSLKLYPCVGTKAQV